MHAPQFGLRQEQTSSPRVMSAGLMVTKNVCQRITPATPEGQAMVARYLAAKKFKMTQASAPKPVRPTIVRPPHFEPGTTAEAKIEALKQAGFVQSGVNGENPLFAHPGNPATFLPFEVYMPKKEKPILARTRTFPQVPMVRIIVKDDGRVITPKPAKHHSTGKRRAKLTPEQVVERKLARKASGPGQTKQKQEKSTTGAKGKKK